MSKLVSPFPTDVGRDSIPSRWNSGQIPTKSCWWRHAMLDRDDDGFLYTWTCHGDINNAEPPEKAWDGIDCVTLEWNDGLSVLLDAGMDTPTIWSICQVYIEPIDYIDLLSENKPTELFYRITEHGDHNHPGMVVIPDLDRQEVWR